MTGHDVQESKYSVLLRYEELKGHLESTKDRLNQAAIQLEELTRILLAQKPSSYDLISRPWLDELIFGQLIGDVIDAERRLADARELAAELGIPLPPDFNRGR
jgi:hypothetical protein